MTLPQDPEAAVSGGTSETATVAAVDLGSNSFHLIVARVGPGEVKILDRLKEMVRLAGGLRSDRTLEPTTEEAALACLERFGQRIRELAAPQVRAIGTNTLRRLRDTDGFLTRAEAALGHPIEVVSGVEEARLIYVGVAHSLAPDPATDRLVIDVGGGSTELILGQGERPIRMESLAVGCVGLSREHFPDGVLTAKNLKAARIAARQELEPLEQAFRSRVWGEAVGASGTVRAVAQVLEKAGWAEGEVGSEGLQRLEKTLVEYGNTSALAGLPGLDGDRAAVFPGGVAILRALFEGLGIEDLQVADGALREGVLHDLMGRLRDEDIRESSTRVLAERFHAEPDQAQRVSVTAETLLEQAAPNWGLDRDWARPYLRWAARLHEIGLDIAHSGYHKHGAYVVGRADLLGFTRQEQALLAALVRAHRRKLPTGALAELPERWQAPATRLAVLLRLAVVLHRNRSAEPLPAFTLRAQGDELALAFPVGWLEDHPLTRADLEEEAERLAVVDVTLAFQ